MGDGHHPRLVIGYNMRTPLLQRAFPLNEHIESDGLLPRFSLQRLALSFTLAIFLAWVIRQAIIGHLWAKAAISTSLSMAVLFAIYAFLFLIIWLPNWLTQRSESFDRSTNQDRSSSGTSHGTVDPQRQDKPL